MAKFEEKFIVINKKHLEEIKNDDGLSRLADSLIKAINAIEYALPKNKYYVCNQDEPYAKKVIDIIIAGENEKGL